MHGKVTLGRDWQGPYVAINCQGDVERVYITEGNLDILRVQAVNLNGAEARNSSPVSPLSQAEPRRPA